MTSRSRKKGVWRTLLSEVMRWISFLKTTSHGEERQGGEWLPMSRIIRVSKLSHTPANSAFLARSGTAMVLEKGVNDCNPSNPYLQHTW